MGTSSAGRRKHKAAGHPQGLVIQLREPADDTCGATEGSNPSCLFMKILFLDDNPLRHKTISNLLPNANIVHVYTAREALIEMNKTDYDLIMLDHDLDEDAENRLIHPDGTYVTQYMIKNYKHLRETFVVIHSLNHSGAKRMQDTLVDGGFTDVYRIPFAWQTIKVKNDSIEFDKV